MLVHALKREDIPWHTSASVGSVTESDWEVIYVDTHSTRKFISPEKDFNRRALFDYIMDFPII